MLHKENGRYLLRISILMLVLVAKSCEPVAESESPLEQHTTVLLISLDGFAQSYLEITDTPLFDSLGAVGVTADALIPVFPSKTFPNHYTQVTGLYPENHGIISNRMYDQRFDEYFTIGSSSESAKDGKWYQGEPIWVTARKQGLNTNTMFWPGSEAEIKDSRPNQYFPFNGSVSIQERIDQVLYWLGSGRDRPHLITLYFEHIDQAGHIHGPNASAVRNAITELEESLRVLMSGIARLELQEFMNLIIISDHGMAQQSRDRVIFLDNYISLNHVEVVNWSPLLELIPLDNNESVFANLKHAHPHLKVYQKQDTPANWHFKHHYRITPILALADVGWSVSSKEYFHQHPLSYRGGAHGYDPAEVSMHGIFIASGPGFRAGAKTPAIESVHLYELICKLLEIEPAENDGDLEVWRHILH